MAERGADHLRSTFYKAELSGQSDPAVIEGKGVQVVDWEDRLCIMDTLIYCRFYRDLVPWPFLTDVVNAAIGSDYSVMELKSIGNRIMSESHEFNRRRGFGSSEEKLPVWITERPLPAAGGEMLTITQNEMAHMRREYYAARDWGEPS